MVRDVRLPLGRRRGVIVTVLALLASAPASARAIVVPDEAPTIQAGINSGADEVLVRPGFYPETIVVSRPMTLRGLRAQGSNEIPETMGLILENTGQQSVEGVAFADLHFRGPVRIAFSYRNPMGPFTLDFSDCVMDSGFTDQLSPAWDQIDCSIARCRIAGGVHLTMPQEVSLGNNIIQGPVRLDAYLRLSVVGNSLEGPGSCGIFGTFEDNNAYIARNTIRGFDVGIWLAGTSGTDVRDNLVEDCSKTGILIEDSANYYRHWLTGNTVRSCGPAINVYGGESLVLGGNVAEDCGSGIFATAGYLEVMGNRVSRCESGLTIEPALLSPLDACGVVSRGNLIEHCGGGLALSSLGDCISDRDTVIDCAAGIRVGDGNAAAVIDSALVLSCGGPGITIDGSWASATRCVVGRSVSDGILLSATGAVTLAGNTAFLNGGSGLVVRDQGSAIGTVKRNIGFGNEGHGLLVDPGTALGLSCNDWFGNAAGATDGLPPGPTDLAVDPWFCSVQVNDVHLAPGSPLADAQGCGLIGALGSACSEGTTATLVTLFQAERTAGGVLVRWRLARAGMEVSVERASAASGPWTSIATREAYYGGEGVELDAAAPEQQACWYRLTAPDDGSRRVIAGPLEVAAAPGGFALARVGPVPATGPIALELTMPRAGTIEITVLDVQGRTVARLAGGDWPAGRHAIEWNGEGTQGRLPPGLYLIRYRFPGGQDSRRIVISR